MHIDAINLNKKTILDKKHKIYIEDDLFFGPWGFRERELKDKPWGFTTKPMAKQPIKLGYNTGLVNSKPFLNPF